MGNLAFRMRAALPTLAGAIALLLAFLAPAAYNGSPFLFPDSVGYSRSGDASIEAIDWLVKSRLTHDGGTHKTAKAMPGPDRAGDGTSTSRSVYYGIPVALLYRLGGLWAVAAAQAALTIGVLLAGLRWFRTEATPWRNVAIVGVVGLVGGLAVFTDAVMPDFFAGLLIFSLAIFVGFYGRMSTKERLAWLALIAFAVLVHKGHLAVLATIIGVAAILALISRRFVPRAFLSLALVLLIAWSGHAAVGLMVKKLTGEPPVPTPFLLSRVVGDGTALPYLNEVCPKTPYLLCRYRDRFPMTENIFLWSDLPGEGVVAHLDQAGRRQLTSEGRAIIIGSIIRDPWRQVGATLANMARQNVTIGVTRYGIVSGLEPNLAPEMASALRHYKQTAVVAGRMPLQAISWMMTASYLFALLGLAVLIARRPSALFAADDRAAALQLIIMGVLINACIFGAVSSTADRYQGRVAWLIPMMLMTLLWPPLAADDAGGAS